MSKSKSESSQNSERELLYKKLCLILAICVVGVLLYFNLTKNADDDKPVFLDSETVSDDELASPIMVHIKGEVVNPGVYSVSGDFRLKDAIEAAGGLTEGADKDALNLAMFISDGDEIIIPKAGSEQSVVSSSDVSRSAVVKSAESSSVRVNINTASVEQLMQLPGIGKSLAEQIIQFRTYIPFKTPDDLKNVPGIGNSKYDELRDLIYVK